MCGNSFHFINNIFPPSFHFYFLLSLNRMRYSHVLLALVVVLFSMVVEASFKNPAPVFGIVSQPCYPQLAEMGCKDYYINAAYVKWLESAGAKSVIIPHTSTTAEIEEIFGSVNGLIFPGGNTDISDPAFHHTLETLYRLAIKSADAGVEIPIWGTCLGMQVRLFSCQIM